MTNIVVVIKDGRVEEILSRNKNIQIEILDMDTQDDNDLQGKERRLKEIHNSKSYKDIM